MTLTKAQEEALNWTQEEAAEVIQIISKIKRHGLRSRHPYIENACSNQEELLKELGDLMAAISALGDLEIALTNQVLSKSYIKLASLENENHFCHIGFKGLRIYPLR